MAWNNVICADCGNEYRVQLYGKHTSRDWKVEHWNGVCEECLAKSRLEASEKAAAEAAETGLPALTGSEKQVNWALTIRARKIKEIEEFLADEKKFIEEEKSANALAEEDEANFLGWEKAFPEILKKETAKFWIDNRFQDSQTILEK